MGTMGIGNSSSSSSPSPPPPQTLTLPSSSFSHPNDVVSCSTHPRIEPEPHISSQFYSFNSESHSLMISCLLENHLASLVEICSVTPVEVLKSWRSAWKDRNEDTAYLIARKRIQEKLNAHVDDDDGNRYLCFKNNSNQFVSHLNQWQEIVMSCHSDTNLKHLGLRETIDKIKQIWTVGAKFYGIPESFIRVVLLLVLFVMGFSN